MGKRDKRKIDIISRATKVFLEFGIGGTSMEAVAQEAKCHRRTLYRYFPQKEDLLYEVTIAMIEEMNDFQLSMSRNLSGRGIEKFTSFLHELSLYLDEHREKICFMGEFDFLINDRQKYRPSDELEQRFHQAAHMTESILSEIVDEGLADRSITLQTDADTFIPTVTTVLWGTAQRIALRGDMIDREFAISGMQMIQCQIGLYAKAIATTDE